MNNVIMCIMYVCLTINIYIWCVAFGCKSNTSIKMLITTLFSRFPLLHFLRLLPHPLLGLLRVRFPPLLLLLLLLLPLIRPYHLLRFQDQYEKYLVACVAVVM